MEFLDIQIFDVYLDYFSRSNFVKWWVFVVTTLLIIAALLNIFKYKKGEIKGTHMIASVVLGLSYGASDYLVALFFIGPYKIAMLPVFTILDVLTLTAILVLTILFKTDKREAVPASVNLIVLALLVNAISHVYYFWVLNFSDIEVAGKAYYFVALIYSLTINFNDLLMIFVAFCFNKVDFLIFKFKKYKSG